ncbi:hypothetical protein [Baekduia soli]|nr:hypothetical protein [Baekduia soli]
MPGLRCPRPRPTRCAPGREWVAFLRAAVRREGEDEDALVTALVALDVGG